MIFHFPRCSLYSAFPLLVFEDPTAYKLIAITSIFLKSKVTQVIIYFDIVCNSNIKQITQLRIT